MAELHARMSPLEFTEWQAFYAWEAKERKRLQREEERKRRSHGR